MKRLVNVCMAAFIAFGFTSCKNNEQEQNYDLNIVAAVDSYNMACNKTNGLKNYTVESITQRKIESENSDYCEDDELKVNEKYDFTGDNIRGIIKSTIHNNATGKESTQIAYCDRGLLYNDTDGVKTLEGKYTPETALLQYSFTLKYDMVKSVDIEGENYTFYLIDEKCPDDIMMEYTLDDKAENIILKAKLKNGLINYVSLEVDDEATEGILALNKNINEMSKDYSLISDKNKIVKTRVFSSTEYSDIDNTSIQFPEFSEYKPVKDIVSEITTEGNNGQ